MAAVVKDDSLLSALFSEPNRKDIQTLCQKLVKRRREFDLGLGTVNVEVTGFVLLLAAQISRNYKNASPSSCPSVPIITGELMKYLLKLIQSGRHDGNGLPIFETIRCFIDGNGGLPDTDVAILNEFVKTKEKELEELFSKKDVTIKEVPSDESQPVVANAEEKEDRRESLMLKLYSQVKTGRKKIGSLPSLGNTPLGNVKGRPPDRPGSTQEGRDFLNMNIEEIKEHDGVQILSKYCLELSSLITPPSFKETSPDKLNRLHQVHTCIQSCLLTSIIASEASPLNSTTVSDIVSVLKTCLSVATTYASSISNIPKEGGVTVISSTSKDDKVTPSFISVPELLQAMSSNQMPCSFTVRTGLSSIVLSTIKMVWNIEKVISTSAKPKVSSVYSAIVAHSILTGLSGLFNSKLAVSGNVQSCSIKLNSPICQLLYMAFNLVDNNLLNQLSAETDDEESHDIKGSELDINSSYSLWGLCSVVLKEVSFIHMLVSSAQAAFKKVLVIADAPSREGSQTDITAEPSFSDIKPKRTDQEEQLFQSLTESLSAKIPVMPAVPVKDTGDSEDEKGTTPQSGGSPASTVSSSGEVKGEYMINPGDSGDDGQENDDGSQEELDSDQSPEVYESLEPLFNVFLPLSLDATPITTAPPPPPPPLPPKKARSQTEGNVRPLPPRTIPRHQTTPTQHQDTTTHKKMCFYLQLSVTALKCLLEGLVQNSCNDLQKFLSSQFKLGHISILSWLFLNVHSLSEDSKNSTKFLNMPHFREMVKFVTELLHEVVVSGIVTPEYHGSLLRDIGLHPACWPLNIQRATLSLLARILICRLQFTNETKDDPLTLSIWNGFLVTLEDNAANEVIPDEDLSVSHLQLLLLIWHNFSLDTRKALLTRCVRAVNRVAEEKDSKSLVPPIAICRLLLVVQYLIFQFSEPAPKLSEQVNGNLLTDSIHLSPPSLTLSPQPPNPSGVGEILCYPSDQNLHFQRIITKPGIYPRNIKDLQQLIVQPLFYNVIPFSKLDPKSSFSSLDDEAEDDSSGKLGVDSDACQILLTCSEKEDGEGRGYDRFYQSLVTLMSCGTDYRFYSEGLLARLTAACAGNQCADICLSLLTNLPPSFDILSSIVDGTKLNLKNDPNSANLFILLNMLSVKLQLQQIDIEDVVDTLTESGHDTVESEELVGRVMSVIGSNDHFVSQSIKIMESFLKVEEDSMLPLMSMICLKINFCLLERIIREEADVYDNEDTADKPQEPTASKDKEDAAEPSEKKDDNMEDDAMKVDTLRKECFSRRASPLCTLLIMVVKKLVSFARIYICRGGPQSTQDINEDIFRVIKRLLSVSSDKLVPSSKNKEVLTFFSHIPEYMQELLKSWNAVGIIDSSLLERIQMYDDKTTLFEDLWSLVSTTLNSCAVQQTFDPSRCLKTAIFSGLVIISSIFHLDKDRCQIFLPVVTPLFTDLLAEFAAVESPNRLESEWEQPLKEIFNIYDKALNRRTCLKLRMMEYFKLVQCPELGGHTFQGVILEDLFILLNTLLESSTDCTVLDNFDNNNPETNVGELVLLCSRRCMSSSTVSMGLTLMVKILKLADENPQEHLTILCTQIASISLVSKERLSAFLRRLVIGSTDDSVTDIINYIKQLKSFTELLTKEDCIIPSHTCQSLLVSLLPLGQELVKSLQTDDKIITVFKDYFICCMMLAGKHVSPGHLGLAKAVMEWLPSCIELTKSDWTIDNGMLHPLRTLMGYLSSLTSALELASNEVKCMERRNMACENEYLVLENGDDDDSIIDDEEEPPVEDDDSLNEALCTFTQTKREFKNQHWYHCHTCKLIDGTGCCSVCVKVCHKGHDVTYSKFGSFFCDCGAKEDGSCIALVKRVVSRANSPVSSTDGIPFSEVKQKRRKHSPSRKDELDYSQQISISSQSAPKSSSQSSSFPSNHIKRVAKQIEPYKDELKRFLVESDFADSFKSILNEALPRVITHRTKKAFGTAEQVNEALQSLYQKKKKIEPTDIIGPLIGGQDGAVDGVKLSLSGDQGQLIKQLLTGGGVRRSAMCATLSSKGQGQLLVVGQDKGKISLYQLSSLLKQTDSNRRKLAINRLGTTTVPFTILSLSSNPSCDEYIAVCGVKDCHVLTVNSSGQVLDKLKLQLSITQNSFLIKVFWLPGSQTELVVVADTFVKIYDLAVDVLSPTYYFTVFTDKIKDACMMVTEQGKYLAVMMSTGHVYCQPVSPECGAADGPVYFTVELNLEHQNIKETGTQICEGGVSVFYSQTLRLLFLSYQNGKSFVVVLDEGMCKSREVVQLNLINNTVTNNGKTTPCPLVDWTDCYQHPGLVSALTQGTSNLVAFFLKPEIIQMYEMKAFPAKAKIQGFTIVRSTNGESAPRTTFLILSEDGSLRAYAANSTDSVQYWLKPQFQPISPLAYVSLQCRKKTSTIKRNTPQTFPVDFFEHCTRMQNNAVDFLGNDILHVYNKEQVKHRFTVGGLYIANTKPSGFSIDVHNLQSDTTVMVGVRVLLGGRSMDRSPSVIEVFNRTKQVLFPSGNARWFDIPFSREESLQADKSFKLTFGPSLDPSGINMVDCVRVYSKTKDEFGWPEKPVISGLAMARKRVEDGLNDEISSDSIEMLNSSGDDTRSTEPLEKLLCHTLSVLANLSLSSMTISSELNEIILKATPLLGLNIPDVLQYQAKYFLSCVVRESASYNVCKDHLQLSHVQELLSAPPTDLQPEQYQHILIILLVITRLHPQHLPFLSNPVIKTLETCTSNEASEDVPIPPTDDNDGCGLWTNIVQQLHDLFWLFYHKRPVNPVISSVASMGLVAVEITVSILVELTWNIIARYPELLTRSMAHFTKLLTSADAQVGSACVKTLMRLLKPRPPKPPTSEAPEEIKDSQDVPKEETDDAPKVEPTPQEQPQQPQMPIDLESALSNPAAAMEQLMSNPAVLGLIPDEDAMMNFAIAMSLHEEGNPGSVQAMQSAMQGLGLPVPASISQSNQGNEGNSEEEEEEEEEEPEEHEEQLEEDIEGKELVLSLNSSLEDLVVPDSEERGDSHSPILLIRRGIPKASSGGGEDKTGEEGKPKDGGGKKDKSILQETSSCQDMPIDSSGEEDAEDPSFIEMHVYEQFEKNAGDTGLSGEKIDEDQGKADKEGGVVHSHEHELRLQLLSALADHISDIESVGGSKAIPYLQLILFLSSCLRGSHKDGEVFTYLLNKLIERLKMEDVVTTPMMTRSSQTEVLLLLLRFFNIIMSRKRMKGGDKVESASANRLWYSTANKLLQSQCMMYSLRLLQGIINSKVNFRSSDELTSVKCDTNLLKPRSHATSMDMGPFFQQQYVKNHASDVFETYSYLLADIALALPCQLKRFCEKTNAQPPLEFNSEWMETLCQYFMASSQTSSSGKKQIRKVLVYVCGSKEKYRLIRDKYALQSHFGEVTEMCRSVNFDFANPSASLVHLPYNSLKKLIEQLRFCDEIAKNRTRNWQSFCLEQKNILTQLFLIGLSFDEGLTSTILQLIHCALSGVHTPEDKEPKKKEPVDKTAKKEKSKEKKPEDDDKLREEHCVSLNQLLLEALNDELLLNFLKRFLLQSNSSKVRWQCHALVHSLYKYSPPSNKVHLIQLLWQLWPNIRGCGHKASQFVDLLGYCTISSPEVLTKEAMCSHLVGQAVELLRKQNSMVQAHSNAHVYSQLSSLVDFDGYYLESDPCLVCNDPEVAFSMVKLYSMKSEVRYSPNTIFLKLNGSYMFSQLLVKINEIRRSKMIRVMNLYYSNRTVQNVIELKNNRSLWLKGASCTLQQAQGEVKLDFPLPIVARNLIIEFADFYENIQVGNEVLQCPRCNTAVPAHPGVCAACGENVHQCHKCRAINYDERDPFLCNSCGFTKYARFDIQVETRPCSAVDPIDNEDDKKKTLSNINQLLEKADGVYKDLVQHRNQLDNLLVALASGAVVVTRSGGGGSSESGVNKAIQAVAQLYCQNCKTSYQELSKTIQSVLASRKELVTYDMKKLQAGKIPSSEPSTPMTPSNSGESMSLSFALSASQPSEGNCFGCASSTLEHCITILKALAFKPETRKLLVKENLIEELVEFNLRSGSADLHKDVQRLLCQLTRDNLNATRNLNEFISRKVLQQIKNQRISPNLISEVQPEIQLLTASIVMEDSCWEDRLRTVMSLFRRSRSHKSPVVMAAVTMPCLKIIHSLINPKTDLSPEDKKKLYSNGVRDMQTNVSGWLKGEPNAGFSHWRVNVTPKEVADAKLARDTALARKYGRIWMDKTLKSKVSSPLATAILKQSLWLKGMLFNPSSQAARKMACSILYSLCDRDIRQKQILDLLSTFLDQVGRAGETSKEYLELFKKLTHDETGRWKLYLARRDILLEIGKLIGKEIEYLLKLEESTLSSDLSQGYALRMLTELLKSFLAVDSIKNQYKTRLVNMVLNGYLSLKRLVTQRTKRIDECQKLLLKMLEDLTSGTEEEKRDLMKECINTLSTIPIRDTATPIFVFEQLCNIILPEEEDIGEFYLSLEKDQQQEEFLQGRMQGNPYSCNEPGLGPLMRDIKNKICTDCELIALLEDDTGMELLVCNKIISLDLPVKEVYKKIWCAQPNAGQRMKVIYRMRGLLGDATEDMVEKLGDGEGKDVDEEEVYKMAATLEKCNGLDAILTRLAQARDFIQYHGLISAGLKLLGFCSKLKVNRQYLIQDRLNTLNILLGILTMSLRYEQQESNGIGAAVAQQVLSVTEPILQESSSQQRVIVRTISDEGTSSNVEDSRLSMLLSLIESPFVQSNLSVREGLMQIIPFLTFGDPRNMTVLLKHFAPYLDFDKFDTEQTPENSLYLDCFCVVANGIGKDESGVKLKDLAIEMKITTSAIEYIRNKTPTTRLESKEWTECVTLPSLPHVLKMLTGLCQNHSNTQLMLCDIVSLIHLLEQVSATENHIGTLAESLLETMRENPECEDKINKVRKETRNEKKKRAMEMRAKELGALGFQVNDKGQLIAKTPSAFKDIEKEVVDETGLRCCICLEGYRNQPQKILGIYTFTKKVTLDEFENKARKTQGCGTVSHFNVVHYDCHSSAIKLARSRDEWESATLQNANTRCNGILPIWGPSVSDSAFASSLARHNAYIQECTGLYDPSFRSYAHDLRLLLLRFSHETSFSSESGGGGSQSNLRLIPYLIHVALYIIDTTRVFQREEKALSNAIGSTPDKWVASSYELEGPLYHVVISLFILSLSEWEGCKLTLLRQLLVLAHARSSSSTPIKSLPASDPASYGTYRPVLILFALVDGLHRLLKKSLPTTSTGLKLLTDTLEYIRNNDAVIGEECDKLLSKYQEELLPVESFAEFCDVAGLLGLIENPDSFLSDLINSVASTKTD